MGSKVHSEQITYMWYLCSDSQSHSLVKQKDGSKVGYLENSIPQYIKALVSAFEETVVQYPKEWRK